MSLGRFVGTGIADSYRGFSLGDILPNVIGPNDNRSRSWQIVPDCRSSRCLRRQNGGRKCGEELSRAERSPFFEIGLLGQGTGQQLVLLQPLGEGGR